MKIKKLAVSAAVFALSLFALTAHAAETEGIRDAIAAGGEVTLTEASTLEGVVTIDAKDVTIDFNGQTLTMAAGTEDEKYLSFIEIKNGGKLTITDSREGGKIVFEGGMRNYSRYGGMGVWILATNNSSLVINGGIIEMSDPTKWIPNTIAGSHSKRAIVIAENGSTVDMNGGEIRLRSDETFESATNAFTATDGTIINFNDGLICCAEDESIPYIFGCSFIAASTNEPLTAIINMNGGVVRDFMYGFQADVGTFNMNGGELSAIACAAEGGIVNISGGKLAGDPKLCEMMELERGIIAVSGDGQLNISGDAAEVKCDIQLFSNNFCKSYFNISGGVYEGTLLPDCVAENMKPEVNISGGQINATITDEKLISTVVTGGTFAPECKDSFTKYVVDGKEIDADGQVVDKAAPDTDLGTAYAFVNVQDGTPAGYFFNVKKVIDDKTTAVAAFEADGQVMTAQYALPVIESNGGDMTFSILLLGAPEGVSGTIEYR